MSLSLGAHLGLCGRLTYHNLLLCYGVGQISYVQVAPAVQLPNCSLTSPVASSPQTNGHRRCRSAPSCSQSRLCSAPPIQTTRSLTTWPSSGNVTRPRRSGTRATGPGCTPWAATESRRTSETSNQLEREWRCRRQEPDRRRWPGPPLSGPEDQLI